MQRALTDAERALARSIFSGAIDYDQVGIVRGKWAFFQPDHVTMAPRGTIYFPPANYHACFAAAPLSWQGHFLHEMTHVWQHQRGVNLILRRHPFCRYSYSIKPGWTLSRYGIEQQAEIVQHVFLLRRGATVPGAPPLAVLESILPFGTRLVS